MNRYKFFSVEDFVQDLRFRSWVKNPSPEEDMLWQQWIKENALKREVIEEARAIVLAIHPINRESISDFEIQHEIRGILERLDDDKSDAGKKSSKLYLGKFWIKIAATISLTLVAGWSVFQYVSKEDTSFTREPVTAIDNPLIERVNKSDKPLLINLPDKSSVLLAQNSLIRYAREFEGNTRKVILEGNAFFEVTKDPDKPFYVHAGSIVAKVLGTSFEISTDPVGKEVRVLVKTGSVSLYAAPDQYKGTLDAEPNVILAKNEQFIYKDNASEIQHIRLDPSSIEELRVPDTYMEFTGRQVATVFSALEKAYGVKINYENAQIKGCSVTASFTDEPFTLKLDLICRSIGVKYELVNDQVTISGNGCK